MDAIATPSPTTSIRLIATDIKLAHSVFALPFALLGAVMAAVPVGASAQWSQLAGQLALVIVAMFFARTCAMLANRLLDRKLDANNPRTVGRALPSGRLPVVQAVIGFSISAVLFLVVCAAFRSFYDNPWPIVLGGPVLIWICAYALLKRFTWLCHLYLGSSLALSPLAAALAVNPDALMTQPALWLLGAMVLCWVAGFDVIYALQDIDIDRRDGLHSIPQRFGASGGLWFARALHLLAAAALIAVLVIDRRLAVLFAVGVVITLALLFYEHATVARWGTTKIALAFFTLNGVISCILGLLGIVDVIV